MSFPRYAAYKDSGVEWLGEVPQGWEVAPVKTTYWQCHYRRLNIFPKTSDNDEYWDGDFNLGLLPSDLSKLSGLENP
jgi:type I restriction enzyme S subunit